MRYLLPRIWVALLLAVTVTACDSSEEDMSDADLIVGNWRVTQVTDGTGDQTDALEAAGTLTVNFTAGGQYAINFDAVDDTLDQTATGTYTVNANDNEIILQVLIFEQPIPVGVEYALEGEDTLDLVISSTAINGVLGTDYEGEVTLTLQRD